MVVTGSPQTPHAARVVLYVRVMVEEYVERRCAAEEPWANRSGVRLDMAQEMGPARAQG